MTISSLQIKEILEAQKFYLYFLFNKNFISAKAYDLEDLKQKFKLYCHKIVRLSDNDSEIPFFFI